MTVHQWVPKPAPWAVQPGLVVPYARPLWRNAKAVFPLWESGTSKVRSYPYDKPWSRWSLNNGAVMRGSELGNGVYFPGGDTGNEIERLDGTLDFVAGEHYTFALVIKFRNSIDTQGIYRMGSSSNQSGYLWTVYPNGALWGRHSGANTPNSNDSNIRIDDYLGQFITLIRTWDGQEVRQYANGRRTGTFSRTDTENWSLWRFGWEWRTDEDLNDVDLAFLGVFSEGWNDGRAASWHADPFAMFRRHHVPRLSSGGGGGEEPPQVRRRPIVMTISS